MIDYKKRLKLLKEIQKRGNKEGINKLASKICASGSWTSKLFNDLESKRLIRLEKTDVKIYSYITARGKRLIKLLIELEELWDEKI